MGHFSYKWWWTATSEECIPAFQENNAHIWFVATNMILPGFLYAELFNIMKQNTDYSSFSSKTIWDLLLLFAPRSKMPLKDARMELLSLKRYCDAVNLVSVSMRQSPDVTLNSLKGQWRTSMTWKHLSLINFWCKLHMQPLNWENPGTIF